MAKPDLAQLIAAAAIGLFVLILLILGRKVDVTTAEVTYTVPDGERTTKRTLQRGVVIPPGDVCAVPAGSRKKKRRSAFSAIVIGKDHRTSTSKTVAFAWTLALAFGLLSLLVAKWLGDDAGWKEQIANGLQEEYLLLLGGPYAAAVLAKYAATGQADQEGRPPAPIGDATTGQLVANDQGDTELGDFQYVLFSLIGLTYFFGTFIGHLGDGLPELPATLTGLVLISTGGYAAKKLLHQARPTLTSIVPPSAAAGGELQIYGTDLIVPPSVAPAGTALPPTVTVGGKKATVTAHDQILGADRLTITTDALAATGPGTVSVVRADGISAVGPAGSDGIAFTVLAP